jgi:phenylacetate-CoA ligase
MGRLLRRISAAAAARRHAVSLAFGRPFSMWALDALVGSLVDTVGTRGGLDLDRLLPDSGLGGDQAATAALQRHRFRTQAAHAARTVPYYRERLAGIRPDELTPAQVPVTAKEALRHDPEAFVDVTGRPFVRGTTTGTTGRPTIVHFSRREWRAIGALTAFPMIASGTVRPDDMVNISITPRAITPNHGVLSACAAAGAVAQVVGMVDPALAVDLLTEQHHLAGHKERVSLLTGCPSYVGRLVEQARAEGRRPEEFGLERMLLGGELVTDGLRRRIRAAFGPVEVRQAYATVELVPFNGDICEAGHVHFDPTSGLVEVIDPDTGAPAQPGAVGTIVATAFRPYRETTILLRYDTGDAVRALPGPAVCRLRNLPATGMLLGKIGSAVRHPDGRWTFAREVAEALEDVDAVPLPARYGFTADGDGVAVEVVIRPGSDDTAARRAIGDALEARGVPLRSLTTVEDRAKLQAPARCRCDFDEGQLIAT